ncbi:MAG: 3-dehydroquinate synthase [bacterium]
MIFVMIARELRVKIGGGRDYPILIGSSLQGELARVARGISPACRLFIVAGRRVADLHLAKWKKPLARTGIRVQTSIIPDGERYKTLATYRRLMGELAGGGDERDTVIAALGGGVVGDIAGFAAATYRRGVPYIQIPTTLLALVDSSVGGKTGVDLPQGKNLAGAFHQPAAVIADLDFLETLPAREFRAGYAEVIKYGAALDEAFFRFLERNHDRIFELDEESLARVVGRCCELKARIVARDERDTAGLRALLNFGHTFAHAFEAAGGYRRYRHGEAVAVGMLCAAELSVAAGPLKASDVERLEDLVARAGLPRAARGLDAREIESRMKHDKKFRAGRTRFVLLEKIGAAYLKSGIRYPDVRPVIRGRLAP